MGPGREGAHAAADGVRRAGGRSAVVDSEKERRVRGGEGDGAGDG